MIAVDMESVFPRQTRHLCVSVIPHMKLKIVEEYRQYPLVRLRVLDMAVVIIDWVVVTVTQDSLVQHVHSFTTFAWHVDMGTAKLLEEDHRNAVATMDFLDPIAASIYHQCCLAQTRDLAVVMGNACLLDPASVILDSLERNATLQRHLLARISVLDTAPAKKL